MSVATIKRQDYDKIKTEEMVMETRNFETPWNEAAALQFHNDGYPKNTAQAIEELIERGLAATPWRIEFYCEDDPKLAPRMIGGVRVWSKEAIDAMAAAMESDNKLTAAAQWRKSTGLGWQDERLMLTRERAFRGEKSHA